MNNSPNNQTKFPWHALIFFIALFAFFYFAYQNAEVSRKELIANPENQTVRQTASASANTGFNDQEQEVYDHAYRVTCRTFGVPASDLEKCGNDAVASYRKITKVQVGFTARDYCEAAFGC